MRHRGHRRGGMISDSPSSEDEVGSGFVCASFHKVRYRVAPGQSLGWEGRRSRRDRVRAQKSEARSIEGEEGFAALTWFSPFPFAWFRSRHEDPLRFNLTLVDEIIVDDFGPILP